MTTRTNKRWYERWILLFLAGLMFLTVSFISEKGVLLKFQIQKSSDSSATIAGQKGGKITISKLLEAHEVKATSEKSNEMTVVEFTVSAVIRGFTKTIQAKSKKFTKGQIEMIKELKPGDIIYFGDIIAVDCNGKAHTLSTVSFKIEE